MRTRRRDAGAPVSDKGQHWLTSLNKYVPDGDRDESPSASELWLKHAASVFESLFERSADAIWLHQISEPQTAVLVDCNQAAVELIGAKSKEQLLYTRPEELSPPLQLDGTPSAEKAAKIIAIVQERTTHRFEWALRRLDGKVIPIEVSVTAVVMDGKRIHVAISREISERKKTERELLELNQSLERKVTERTAELSASEARFRVLVEHAPDAILIDNTERKRAERALRESEAKFRALFEGTSNGVVLMDPDKLLEVNPAAVRILGRQSADEMVGKHPSAFSPFLQPNGVSSEIMAGKYIEECLAKGSVRLEWLCASPEGLEIPLEVLLTRIEWSGRQVIQACITDITERKQAERALRESEARFSTAFRASPVSIVIMRMDDGCCILANESFLNWIGYPLDEVVGRNSLELGMWADPEERASIWQELRLARSIRERECRMRNRQGKSFIMLVSADVIEIKGVPHVLAVGLDITERKRAQAAMEESEARFGAAFRASPALIGVLRLSDGKYVLVNDAHVNWLGLPREEILGRRCLELGMWEDPGERELLLKDVDACGSVRHRECRWKNRRGEQFTVLLSAEIIKLQDAPHMLLTALDISQRKRAEEELLKTLEREKELSQLKSNFVSMVSHEFRTPLGIIQSSAELLRDFQEKMRSDERAEQLTSIAKNTRRMAGMMEEVLVLSRLDAGKLEFQPVALDLSVFCQRVVDEVLSATNRRCLIKLSLTDTLPEANADEQLLGHIFTNLLSNAVKYSEPGASVHFFVQRNGRDAVCVIADKGIGISEEDQQQLFKTFHRGSNVGNLPGTGLGLVLVKRCVELHGGKLQLESKLGQGTTVTVKLPVFGGRD